jgi:hypothetical protein
MMKRLLLLLCVLSLMSWPSNRGNSYPSAGNPGGAAAPVLVQTVDEFETEAATATDKTIAIPSGTFFANAAIAQAVSATGGSTNGGASGGGQFTAADADVTGVAAGHWIIITTEAAAPPHEGEFCKIDLVASAAGTTTMDCEQILSGAPDANTTFEVSDPINIQPTFPANEDRNLTILCDGSGFGRGAATDSSIVLEIDGASTAHDHGVRFVGCTFAGNDTASSGYEVAVITTGHTAGWRLFMHEPVTANLQEEGTTPTHDWVTGNRFLVVDDVSTGGVQIEISDAFVDALLPFHLMGAVGRVKLDSGTYGSTSLALNREYGCLYAGDYLGVAQTNYSSGNYNLDGTKFQNCRWFHFGNTPTVTWNGEWLAPSSIYNHALPEDPDVGWLNSFSGWYDLDVLIVQDPTDGTLPESPLIYLEDDSGTPSTPHIIGEVFDPGCLVSRIAGSHFLIGSDTSATAPAFIDFRYMQGEACQGTGNFDFLTAATIDNIDDSALDINIRIYARDESFHMDSGTTSYNERHQELDTNSGADDGLDWTIKKGHLLTGGRFDLGSASITSTANTVQSATPTYSFFDTDFALDGGFTVLECAADNNCSITTHVNSGTNLDWEPMFRIYTTGDATETQIGSIDDSTWTSIDEAGNLHSLGTIRGNKDIVVTVGDTDSPSAAEMRGTWHIADNATAANDVDYTLPEISTIGTGANACFYDNGGGGGGIIIDAAAGDEILLYGAGVGVADAIDSPGVAGAGANGDYICLVAIDSTYWITTDFSGTWVDGGAD